MTTPSLKDLRRSLGTYQNASAITGVLQLAVDALNLEVATLLRHGGAVLSVHVRQPVGPEVSPKRRPRPAGHW